MPPRAGLPRRLGIVVDGIGVPDGAREHHDVRRFHRKRDLLGLRHSIPPRRPWTSRAGGGPRQRHYPRNPGNGSNPAASPRNAVRLRQASGARSGYGTSRLLELVRQEPSQADMDEPHAGLRLGVDIGGTFTDFCVFDETTGSVRTHKTLSTPETPGAEVMNGIEELASRHGWPPDTIRHFTHGTTVGVNTVIQRRGAALALFTTRGFEDVLEIARLKVPDPYDLFSRRPPPPRAPRTGLRDRRADPEGRERRDRGGPRGGRRGGPAGPRGTGPTPSSSPCSTPTSTRPTSGRCGTRSAPPPRTWR